MPNKSYRIKLDGAPGDQSKYYERTTDPKKIWLNDEQKKALEKLDPNSTPGTRSYKIEFGLGEFHAYWTALQPHFEAIAPPSSPGTR